MTFNAHHAPIGAYASLTVGSPGYSGFSMEAGMPPEHELLVGVEAPDGVYEALPFFVAGPDEPLRALAPVARDFGIVRDTWDAPGVRLRIVSPLRRVPEPGVAAADELRDALAPAVLVELTIDNLAGEAPRRGFFGVRAATGPHGPSPWGPTPRLTHAHAREHGFTVDDGNGRTAGAFCIAPDATAAAGTSVAAVLGGPPGGSGNVAALRFEVPAQRRVSYLIAVAFWHGGTVASGPGRRCAYWYTRLFAHIEDVAVHALEGFARLTAEHLAAAADLEAAELSDDQRFQLAHATRSYFGNTALLATDDGRPLWVVVEGEYMFMNTLDLTVDQVFFELRQNPWTVRNELDEFVERHRFRDRAGIGFTHDMGAWPNFSAPATSAYEKRVHMAGEELANWALTALTYVAQTGDEAWARAHLGALELCLESLLARAPDGLPCGQTERMGPAGEEITTYDALDASLRQARHSSYLASKQWAAFVCLGEFFGTRGHVRQAAVARRHAHLVADRLVEAAHETGYLPAIVAAAGEPANPARVIPVVECLVYPLFAGAAAALAPGGEYADYVEMLVEHLGTVLTSGACLFADGGWKLSSTHDNTWLSKIFLGQFVARHVLGAEWDEDGRRADAAHGAWLRNPELSHWSWSDQIIAGAISSSRYYPRGVTAALWLEEHPATARLTTLHPDAPVYADTHA